MRRANSMFYLMWTNINIVLVVMVVRTVSCYAFCTCHSIGLFFSPWFLSIISKLVLMGIVSSALGASSLIFIDWSIFKYYLSLNEKFIATVSYSGVCINMLLFFFSDRTWVVFCLLFYLIFKLDSTVSCTVIRAPGMQALKISLSKPRDIADGVSVWEWCGSALDEGAEASNWFTNYLGKPSRLVRYNAGWVWFWCFS